MPPLVVAGSGRRAVGGGPESVGGRGQRDVDPSTPSSRRSGRRRAQSAGPAGRCRPPRCARCRLVRPSGRPPIIPVPAMPPRSAHRRTDRRNGLTARGNCVGAGSPGVSSGCNSPVLLARPEPGGLHAEGRPLPPVMPGAPVADQSRAPELCRHSPARQHAAGFAPYQEVQPGRRVDSFLADRRNRPPTPASEGRPGSSTGPLTCTFTPAETSPQPGPLALRSRARKKRAAHMDDPPLTCGFSVGLTGFEPATP